MILLFDMRAAQKGLSRSIKFPFEQCLNNGEAKLEHVKSSSLCGAATEHEEMNKIA